MKRRAFFILMALGIPAYAAPTPGQSAPDYILPNKPDAAETRRIIEQFQGAGIAGEYFLTFELHILPRRGDERVLAGKMWGGRNEQGAITRVVLVDETGKEHRWLLQNGAHAAAWSFIDGKIAQVGSETLFSPLVNGVDVAAFDLLMPFVYWPDYSLENLVRLRGRPTHVFLFHPPAGFAVQLAGISGVRVYLDTQFNAPVQTELLNREGVTVKTLSLMELKQVGKQPMIKTIDVRNETTRDKTRFQVTGVALALELPPSVFAPASLAEDLKSPPPERITRFDR